MGEGLIMLTTSIVIYNTPKEQINQVSNLHSITLINGAGFLIKKEKK